LDVLDMDPDTVDTGVLPSLEDMVAREPDNLSALLRVGALRQRLGQPDRAREAYEQALATNAHFTPVALRLACLYAEAFGDVEKALVLARRAREDAPQDPEVAETLGRVAFQSGDYAWARGLFQQAAEARPESAWARYRLGLANYMLGRVPAAQTELRHALELDPAFPEAARARQLLALVDLTETMGQPDAALRQAREILADKPNDLPALMLQATAQERLGDAPEALRLYRAILDRYPAFAPAARNLARLFVEQQVGEAEPAYRAAMTARDLLPRDPEVAGVLGKIAYRREQFEWALQLLDESARQLPDRADILFYQGMANYKMGNFSAARQALEHALELNPALPQVEEARRTLAEVTESPIPGPD
jgi:Flp pilus assembly protein TadD